MQRWRTTTGIQQSVHGLLDQQKTLLSALTKEEYIYICPTMKASIGGHVRHTLDHILPPLTAATGLTAANIHYDKGSRDTLVESDVFKALDTITSAQERVSKVRQDRLPRSIAVHFMLTSDGKETEFQSTIGRELAFAVHHGIHHHAMIKLLVMKHFRHIELEESFGMAPSTTNFIIENET